MDTAENKLAVIHPPGFQRQGNLVLRENDWIADYDEPMEKFLVEKAKERENILQLLSVVDEARHEIALSRKYSNYCGNAFVMRLPEPLSLLGAGGTGRCQVFTRRSPNAKGSALWT